MKSQTKKWIRLSAILYIVILSVVAVVTLAWFVIDETASLETATDMKITAGNKLEIIRIDATGKPISPNDNDKNWTETWGQSLELKVGDRTYPDITYDYSAISRQVDGGEFYFPTSVNDSGIAIDESYRLIPDSMSEDYYITVNLRFRSTVRMDVYLEDDSYVSGVAQTLVGPNAENKSDFGDFSCDGIAGAVRVAFFEHDINSAGHKYNLKNIWIPNDKYHLTQEDNVYTFSTGGQTESDLGYMTKTDSGMLKMEWTKEQYCEGLVTLDSQKLASVEDESGNDIAPMIYDSTAVLSFTEADKKESGFYEKDLVIKIWIEGTDREANSVFSDGQLKYNLKFSGIQKEVNPVDNSEDPNSFKNKPVIYKNEKLYFGSEEGTEVTSDDGLLYSLDGLHWNPYSSWNSDNPAPTTDFYVRYEETNIYKPSKTCEVKIATQDQ